MAGACDGKVTLVTGASEGSNAALSIFKPVETMAEAALVLCTGDPNVLTGRIAYSLQLLLELERPVRDLQGRQLVEGWQPGDLAAAISAREAFFAGTGWPRIFDFHRPSTPRPAVLS
jgi:hypothetical protein